ncbi:MAG: monovalent cation/H(+) antiporter subunit G [Candidatus Eremiobacteraeota bacterium]|nr:monovalent cation/H(+) antiporter subunit G [Candidatus Eremiobacteraeota bacterium]
MALVAVAAILALACVLLALSALGLVTMRDPVNKLHYVGPVTTLVPILICIAIVVEEGFTSVAGLKSVSIALVMLVTGPIASYATLRALAMRARGDVVPLETPVAQ